MIRDILNNMTVRGKWMIITAVVFFILYSFSGTAVIVLILDMINRAAGGSETDISIYWLFLVLLVVFKAACNIAADMAKHFAGFDIVQGIREKLILRLKQFSLGFYSKERLGEISTIIHKDVDNMEAVVAHMWTRMISDFVVTALLFTCFVCINWKLAVAMVFFIPAGLFLLFKGICSASDNQKNTQDSHADMVSLFAEYVKGIPVFKSFSNNRCFQNRLNSSIEEFGNNSRKNAKLVAGYLGRYSFFIELSFAFLVISGAYLVYVKEIDLFTYLVFIALSREFYKPFANMEGHWLNYIKVKDSFNRIQTVLKSPVVELPGETEIPDKFNINFDSVNFSYSEGAFELDNVSFSLEQNSLTALVGPSGSGKTTITNLLLRFWDPSGGFVRIGGVDICNIEYDYLLSNISIVMQNVILFSDTIYNNILIGKRNASHEEVVSAAEKAMIHDYIMGLPDGYNTLVGENGVGLSGGQKQRISIARAFLKDAPIVILDEITSNVDPVNESQIQKAISNLAEKRTFIVIAHHLNTIKSADKIIVFENGRIAEQGKHSDLVLNNNLYKKLWDSQKLAGEIGIKERKLLAF